jgi:hypothetical protein
MNRHDDFQSARSDFDRYDVAIVANLSSPTLNGLTNDQFYFQFEKTGMFSNDGLPTSPPSIASVVQKSWYLDFHPVDSSSAEKLPR